MALIFLERKLSKVVQSCSSIIFFWRFIAVGTAIISIAQAAEMLGRSVATLRRWDARGILQPEYRMETGRRRAYTLRQIEEYLEKQRTCRRQRS